MLADILAHPDDDDDEVSSEEETETKDDIKSQENDKKTSSVSNLKVPSIRVDDASTHKAATEASSSSSSSPISIPEDASPLVQACTRVDLVCLLI
jgi:hypothetical protein